MSLEQLGTGQGFLKAGLLGFQKSGKSFTAVCLAIGTWKHFDRKGRIVMFDTEGGSEYIAPMVLRQTGQPLLGKKARSFQDLMSVAADLKTGDILLVDSITHPWRELCDSHLASVNKLRAKKKLPPRTKLEFQDYGPLKKIWEQWTDWYLNSQVHIIIAGRAGFEYEMETNEETNKRELIKTGVKMKTETEFGFEPSLLVEVSREFSLGDKTAIVHRAVVIGDRFNVIDGQQIDFKGGLPEEEAIRVVFKFFKPHVDLLLPGSHSVIDTSLKTETGVGEDGDAEWSRERREREILCEETKAVLVKADLDGNGAEAKKQRVLVLEKAFGTAAWTRIENMRSSDLRAGLARLKEATGQERPLTRIFAEFHNAKELIGEQEYYRILEAHGMQHANDSKDVNVLNPILSEMVKVSGRLQPGGDSL